MDVIDKLQELNEWRANRLKELIDRKERLEKELDEANNDIADYHVNFLKTYAISVK